MTINRNKIHLYLDSNIVDGIYKILSTIWRKNNVGLEKYISSLLIELYGFDNVFKTDEIGYVSLLATLEGIKIEACKKDNKRTVKREVFKCMEIVKNSDYWRVINYDISWKISKIGWMLMENRLVNL